MIGGQLVPQIGSEPIEDQIFYMQLTGLHFTELEFFRMPTRRRARYLAACNHHNKKMTNET